VAGTIQRRKPPSSDYIREQIIARRATRAEHSPGSDVIFLLKELPQLAGPLHEERLGWERYADLAGTSVEQPHARARLDEGAQLEERFRGARAVGIRRRRGNVTAGRPAESRAGQPLPLGRQHPHASDRQQRIRLAPEPHLRALHTAATEKMGRFLLPDDCGEAEIRLLHDLPNAVAAGKPKPEHLLDRRRDPDAFRRRGDEQCLLLLFEAMQPLFRDGAPGPQGSELAAAISSSSSGLSRRRRGSPCRTCRVEGTSTSRTTPEVLVKSSR
jgi:hypothetical protein